MINPQDKHDVNGTSSRKGESKRHQQTRRPASLYQVPLAIALMVAAVGSGTSVQAQSPADCAARADRAARNTGGVIGGAAVGSLGGAAVGAIVSSSSRRGARRGAWIGGAVGGTTGAVRKNNTYRRVYDDCMTGR